MLQDYQEKLLNRISTHLKTLLNFLIVKIKDSYENFHEAFRAFDIRNKGLVTKSDFTVALDNFKIKLSSSDIDQIFGYLDQSNDGSLNY